MSGLEIICGIVLFIGLMAVLFCASLAASARHGRGAIGFFVFATLFCCLLVAVISTIFFG